MLDKRLIWEEIKKHNLGNDIHKDELLKYHTSWKIGGFADFFSVPQNLETLKNIITFSIEHELPVYIIGNGSNILVPDDGIRGLVLKISGTLDKIEYSGKMMKTGAGVLLPSLVRKTVQSELSGLEFAAHIPGTLGGALSNNASFGSKSISDIVHKIVILDFQGNIKEIEKAQCNFFYRGLDIGLDRYVILTAYLLMQQDNKDNIIAKIKEVYDKRKKTQPTEYLTAGCIFKNSSYSPAGYLIEKSGAKGLIIGDAQVSEKHANFIINKGNASSKDILLLIEAIEKKVKKEFGITLEREIEFIGF